jgi:hypothetical protein
MLLPLCAAALLAQVAAMPQLSDPMAAAVLRFQKAVNASQDPNLGIVNGRVTSEGEWEGTVMVIGSNGDCDDSGLCTGAFIHRR